jgi:Uma2 family endonuclease
MNKHIILPAIPRATQAAEGLPRWRWTTAELLRLVELKALDENERIELIGGEIVPLPPRSRRHEVLADELAQFWVPRLTNDTFVSIEKQFNLDEATYTTPDLLVRPTAIKTYDVRGDTALLVIEVAASSWDYDISAKAELYARFGVADYWVIHADTRNTRIHRQPKADGYAEVITMAANDRVVPLLVPQLTVRLADLDAD